ncbi:hypothetical protein ACH5RR_040557 [Cinchona calisaya]|uniref:Uncharacterized protein n=1 Tax=Cinchona calisaya TaxID=153742 RepID=A0ABD2XUP3_9GENT
MNGIAVNIPRRSRGLALLWKKEIDASVICYYEHFVDATELFPGQQERWRLMGYYGKTNMVRRKDPWDRFKHLQNANGLPWICLRDFNKVLEDREWSRRASRPH